MDSLPESETFDVDEFSKVVERVRRGDAQATDSLIEIYDNILRELIFAYRENIEITKSESTTDIVQSVWGHVLPMIQCQDANELPTPDLICRLIDEARRVIKAKLDQSLTESSMKHPLSIGLIDHGSAPQKHVERRDLLEKVRREMPANTRRYFDLWLTGMSWPKIAEGTGRTADAIRKEVTRRIDLISQTCDIFD